MQVSVTSQVSQVELISIDTGKSFHKRGFCPKIDQTIQDSFKVTIEQLIEILRPVKEIYELYEKSSQPPEGYVLTVEMKNRGKRPLYVELDVRGIREAATPMKMPPRGGLECKFCTKTEFFEKYEGLAEEGVHVIESLEGNPLVISAKHAGHILELPVEDMAKMILTGFKVIQLSPQGHSRHRITSNCGEGQTYPHPHIHEETTLGELKG